jgi:predicted MFS family arabinose efflux permease
MDIHGMGLNSAGEATVSPWAPLRERSFLLIWSAAVISNIGTWMHDVAAAWLMTSLTPAPLMVALIQAATTLPVFLFALPAGALADLIDRRRLLLALQVTAAALAVLLAVIVSSGLVTPGLLLLFTFLLGTTAAMGAPAWQAITPDLVSRPLLTQAVALNGVGINIARAIGPALGGLIITVLGLAWPFAFNALSFLAVILALWLWRPQPKAASTLPTERLAGAIRSGLRYAHGSAPLRATLVRSASFFLFASAFWALLPLVVRGPLAGGPALYGTLLACVGIGAVAAALLLPKLKARLGADGMVMAGTGLLAGSMALLALLPIVMLALPACLLAGLAWISVMSSLNVSAQLALPAWVRSRGLAVSLAVFFGSMTAGSILWGLLAGLIGLLGALLVAAAGALAGILLSRPWHLLGDSTLDLSPSGHWPAPILDEAVATDGGPVLVTVEYEIDPPDGVAFAAAIDALSHARRRDGAFFWQVFTDAENPRRRIEAFMLESWLDHLRQHERVTVEDRQVQERVRAFHRGSGPPRVTHLIAGQQVST